MAAGAAELLDVVVGPEGDSSFRIERRASAGGQRGRRGNFFVCRKARGNAKGAGEREHSLQRISSEHLSLRFDGFHFHGTNVVISQINAGRFSPMMEWIRRSLAMVSTAGKLAYSGP